MNSHIDNIIQRMGYSNSSCLKYRHQNFDTASLSAHTVKVLRELSPYAVYMVDNNPFVLFFEEILDKEKQKQLNIKIWNAQIPVAFICGAGTVTIYNGCTIDKNNSTLTEIMQIPFQSIDENSPFSFWEITNQNFWLQYKHQFSGEKLNDVMLRNLTDITEKLSKVFHLPFATILVLRLIFIRYLIDRGVDLDYNGFSSDVSSSQTALLRLLNDKNELYNLFKHLKDKFNGNLFELGNEVNNKHLTEDVFKLLSDFLSGSIDITSGQRSLFNLYDFNIIPVELISNIYEILLGNEARNRDNAFFTPQYLVDYILDKTIVSHIKENETCKVLDPSCGSGIFLVNSYKLMVEKKLNGELFTENDTMLCEILTNNIYGIDINPDAIDVAIFSLYLAVLDYKNPKTLVQFKLPELRGKTILECDFFDEKTLSPFQKIGFHFIIGNPPWSSKMGLHVSYCKNRGYMQYIQNNDTCRSFILRSKDFSSAYTNCCFVLHSKMLYMQKQQSKKFREFLLEKTEIIGVIELSSVRKLVFKNADAPATIITYRFSEQNVLENRFEYISMKPSIFFDLFSIIVIEKNDIKRVRQKLLKENDWAWKTILYGLSGDFDALRKLKSEYPILDQALKNQRPALITGTGVQYNDGDKQDAGHLVRLGEPLLESGAIDHFSIDLNKKSEFKKSHIHRTRDERLFQAPYCLVRKGLDMSDYTMRAVYSEDNFIFKEAIYAIKGNSEQKYLLQNITGLLNSSAYAYFNLMLNSSLGIEREQRQAKEVLTFPFVYSESIANQVEKILNKINNNMMFASHVNITAEIAILNQMILDAFQLSDNEFVDYALKIQIPQLTGSNDGDVYRNTEISDFEIYGRYFYDYLSTIFSKSKKYVKLVIYPKVAKYYNIFEVVVSDSPSKEWIRFENNSRKIESTLAMLSAHKINDLFYYLKDVLYFDKTSFCIIKPNYYKNWHPAIAKLDLMEVVDIILSRKEGSY